MKEQVVNYKCYKLITQYTILADNPYQCEIAKLPPLYLRTGFFSS